MVPLLALLSGTLVAPALGTPAMSIKETLPHGTVTNGQVGPNALTNPWLDHWEPMSEAEEKLVHEMMSKQRFGSTKSQFAPKPRDMVLFHKKMDEDKNGEVSYPEMIDWAERAHHKMMEGQAHKFKHMLVGPKEQKVQIDKLGERWTPSYPLPEALKQWMIDAVDTDKDEHLDVQEITNLFNEWHEPILNKKVERLMKIKDKDGDGVLTCKDHWDKDKADSNETQHLAGVHEAFEFLDSNQDKVLTKDEIRPYESGHWNLVQAIQHLFHSADADKSKGVSVKEMAGALFDQQVFEGAAGEWLHGVLEDWNVMQIHSRHVKF